MNDAVKTEDGATENKGKDRHVLKRILFISAVFGLGILLVNAVFFLLGIRTGFFHRWVGEQYAGTVIEIRGDVMFVQGRGKDGGKEVFLGADTAIRKGRDRAALEDLKVGQYVVVIGPSRGTTGIDAEVIRIFDGDDPPNPHGRISPSLP